MTKAELIAQLAAESGQSKAAAQSMLDSLVSAIIETLRKEGRFALAGLGSFEVVERSERQGRNPRTGEPMTIQASKAVKFKAAKAVKDSVN